MSDASASAEHVEVLKAQHERQARTLTARLRPAVMLAACTLAVAICVAGCSSNDVVQQLQRQQQRSRLRNEFSKAELAMLNEAWPMELLEDPSRQALEVHTPEEFLRAVLVADHLDNVVIFPHGTSAFNLTWEETAPPDMQQLLAGRRNGADVAQGLLDEPGMLDRYDWRLDVSGGQHMDFSSGHCSDESSDSACEPTQEEASEFRQLLANILAEVEKGALEPQELYFAEVAHRRAVARPGVSGEKRASIFSLDFKDVLGRYGLWNLHWANTDAGLFVGGRFSGTALHVDRSLWSDVGKNFQGYKLLAVWPVGSVGAEALAASGSNYQELFRPPLDAERLRILRTAAKVTLLRPEDVYLFSGGVPHCVLCISEDELCLGSYESGVTLHPRHVQLWKHKGIPNMKCDHVHCIGDDAGAGEDPALEADMHDEFARVVQNLNALAKQVQRGGPTATRATSASSLPMPARWEGILRNLDADAGLQARLKEHLSQAVEVLMRNKAVRAHMPKAVLRAAGWDWRMYNPSAEDEYRGSSVLS